MVADALMGVGIDLWAIVKWFVVFAFVTYFVFTLVVMRQIELMVRTLSGALNVPIRVVGWFLVAAGGMALLASMMVL